MSGLYNAHLLQFLESASEFFLAPRLFVFLCVNHPQRHRQSNRWVLNMSPESCLYCMCTQSEVSCGVCRIPFLKIHSDGRERHNIPLWGPVPYSQGSQASFFVGDLPQCPSGIAGVPRSTQHCHISQNILPLGPPEPGNVVPSLGASELTVQHVALFPHLCPPWWGRDPPLSQTPTHLVRAQVGLVHAPTGSLQAHGLGLWLCLQLPFIGCQQLERLPWLSLLPQLQQDLT